MNEYQENTTQRLADKMQKIDELEAKIKYLKIRITGLETQVCNRLRENKKLQDQLTETNNNYLTEGYWDGEFGDWNQDIPQD